MAAEHEAEPEDGGVDSHGADEAYAADDAAGDFPADFDESEEAYDETEDYEAPAPRAPRASARRRRNESNQGSAGGALALAAGLLVTAAGAVQLYVPAAAAAMAATGFPAQLAVTVGVVLVALGLSQRKVGKMQQRMAQLELQREARDEHLQETLEELLDRAGQDVDGAANGAELEQALLALQRQDQKINNLTKATKMYGKPLMEIAAQCAELVGGVGQLREQVERSESASRDVDLGDVPAQLAALAEATSTLRTEASAERAELKAALEQGGDDQLQVRLAEATTRIGDGIDQLRTQELSGLESTLRDVQREVSSLATSVAQLQASARSGDQASSRPAAATAATTPAAAQPTTGDAGTSKSSGYSTGARKSGGKNVLGAIAKLKQMKG